MQCASGNYQRTRSKHRLLLSMIYISTLTAARTFPWTPSDPQLAGIPYHITTSEFIISETTMQPAATVWLSEDKERRSDTVPHRLPVHKPEPAVARTTWRPRDCIPKVEIHPRPYGIMPHSHPTNRHQAATQWTKVTPELLHDRLQSPVRRSPEAAYHTELSRSSNSSPTAITTTRYMHYIYYIAMEKPKTQCSAIH